MNKINNNNILIKYFLLSYGLIWVIATPIILLALFSYGIPFSTNYVKMEFKNTKRTTADRHQTDCSLVEAAGSLSHLTIVPLNFHTISSCTISGSRLNMSGETSTLTPLLYQRDLLSQPSFTRSRLLSPAPVSVRKLAKWICLFEVCFVLRCIQHLSLDAWRPGDTLPDNP